MPRPSEHLTGHPPCERRGHQDCAEPSGRSCIEGCGRAAGTHWGPYYCPDCDSVRMDRITKQLEALAKDQS